MPDRQAGIGDDDAVEEHFDNDMLAGVFVVTVREGANQGLAEGGLRILEKFDTLKADNAGCLAGILPDD